MNIEKPKTYTRDGIEYTASNKRMRYHPDFCENHGQLWSEEDLKYLCGMWSGSRKLDIAMALGRSHSTVLSKAHRLKSRGMFEAYRKMYEEELL